MKKILFGFLCVLIGLDAYASSVTGYVPDYGTSYGCESNICEVQNGKAGKKDNFLIVGSDTYFECDVCGKCKSGDCVAAFAGEIVNDGENSFSNKLFCCTTQGMNNRWYVKESIAECDPALDKNIVNVESSGDFVQKFIYAGGEWIDDVDGYVHMSWAEDYSDNELCWAYRCSYGRVPNADRTACVDPHALDANVGASTGKNGNGGDGSTKTTAQNKAGAACSKSDLSAVNYATAGVYVNSGGTLKCAATACKSGTYLVVNTSGQSQGWCVAANYCSSVKKQKNHTLNIIDRTKTDLQCVAPSASGNRTKSGQVVAQSQTYTLSGTVVDNNAEPLVSATINIGPEWYTTTDEKGAFSKQYTGVATDSATVSFLGCDTMTFAVADLVNKRIEMECQANLIDGSVVVADDLSRDKKTEEDSTPVEEEPQDQSTQTFNISGRVVDTDGNPVPYAIVFADDKDLWRIYADKDGRFSGQYVGAPDTLMSANQVGCEFDDENFVEAARMNNVTFQLDCLTADGILQKDDFRVTGRARDIKTHDFFDGKQIVSMKVHGTPTSEWNLTSDKNGRWDDVFNGYENDILVISADGYADRFLPMYLAHSGTDGYWPGYVWMIPGYSTMSLGSVEEPDDVEPDLAVVPADEANTDKIDELRDNYNAMKENEQSFANRMLGAASMGSMGIGGMMVASSLSEQKSDADAEQDMAAYLETFRCDYGAGRNIKGGEANIELPGASELIPLYSEYVSLANDLKLRKEQLGLKAGIEAEKILDSATTGLYDDVSTGITGGAYASLARALQNPDGEDAKLWAAQKEKTAKNLKTGAITAGVGAVVGIAGNVLINHKVKNNANEIVTRYESMKRLKQDVDNIPPATTQCPGGTSGVYPNCECSGNAQFNPNLNKCENCTGGQVAVVENDMKKCSCPDDKPMWDSKTKQCVAEPVACTPQCQPTEGSNLVVQQDCTCVCINGFTMGADGACVCDGKIENGTCVIVQVQNSSQTLIAETETSTVSLNADNLFEIGKHELRSEAKTALEKFAYELKNKDGVKDCKIEITGYTDPVGSAALNQTLSEQRANAVSDYLKSLSDFQAVILAGQPTVRGMGENSCFCGAGTMPVPDDKKSLPDYKVCVGKTADTRVTGNDRYAPCRRVDIKATCKKTTTSSAVIYGD